MFLFLIRFVSFVLLWLLLYRLSLNCFSFRSSSFNMVYLNHFAHFSSLKCKASLHHSVYLYPLFICSQSDSVHLL